MGGGLIAASFLVAVLLNRSAHEEGAPVKRDPPAHACADRGQRPPARGTLPLPDPVDAECERSQSDPAQR